MRGRETRSEKLSFTRVNGRKSHGWEVLVRDVPFRCLILSIHSLVVEVVEVYLNVVTGSQKDIKRQISESMVG